MSSDPSRTVVVTRRIAASAERVFDAWLDPGTARKWLFATPTGQMVKVEIDARVGGRFAFVDRRDGVDVEHVGEYLEIDRPRRLVFTFSVPKYSAETSQVTIDILPIASGCELRLTHENILPDYVDRTQSGWTKLLGDLAGRVGEIPPRRVTRIAPDTLRFERLLPGPTERVWEYLVDSQKLSQWLAAGTLPPRVGGEATLVFDDARLSPGYAPPPEKYQNEDCRVAVCVTKFEPPRLLAYTWREGNATSEVQFDLVPEDDRVRLTLTHRRLPSDTIFGFICGWHAHLDILEDRLGERTPPAFWTLFQQIEREYAVDSSAS